MYPNKNLLSAKEIEYLQNSNVEAILNISKRDVLRGLCTHIDHTGETVVQELKDGSGNVWCPICNAVWDPRGLDKEEVQKIVLEVINCIQNMKYMNTLPETVGRDFYSVIPILEKLPELYEYAHEIFMREPVNEPFRTPSHINGMYQQNIYDRMYAPGIIPQPYQREINKNGVSNDDFPDEG